MARPPNNMLQAMMDPNFLRVPTYKIESLSIDGSRIQDGR
jgi:hypothetical protein